MSLDNIYRGCENESCPLCKGELDVKSPPTPEYYELHEKAWKVVQLLNARSIQKENLTTRIIRDYVLICRKLDGLIAENNKLRAIVDGHRLLTPER